MEFNIKNLLLNAPDLSGTAKKLPGGLLTVEQANHKIEEEIGKYKPESILAWRRQTGTRVFLRGANIEAGHLEIDVNRYGEGYFITISNVPPQEETVIDIGAMGDIFKLYILNGKLALINEKSEKLELPLNTDRLFENDFFKDLFLDGTSDCCQLTWRTTMRVISELEKNGFPQETVKSLSEFLSREILSWPFQLIIVNNKFIVTNKKISFELEVPKPGIPLKHDSLVEFMGFITGLTGNSHSDNKQLENLNKLNDILPARIIDFLQEAKEQALIHTDPKYARDVYDKIAQIKILEDPESGDILVAVPYSEEELLQLKKKIVQMLREGAPKENLPPIADENRKKLGISNYFVPIQVTPIWCGMSIYVTPEKENSPIITTRILNQLRSILKKARIYFEEAELSEEESLE